MRPRSGKKPKRLGYTVKRLLGYMGRHKLLLFAAALLVTLSAECEEQIGREVPIAIDEG